MDNSSKILSYEKQFDEIRLIIENHKRRAYHVANYEQIATYWEVGRYVSNKIKTAEWGSKIVTNLALYLKTHQPDLKGFDRRAIYRMVQFFDTYSSDEFANLLSTQENNPDNPKQLVGIESPLIQSAYNKDVIIVGNETPQFDAQLLNILSLINWSSHLEIISGCSSHEERLYYILLTYNEKLFVRELARKIAISDYENRLLGNNNLSNQFKETYPTARQFFKDFYMTDFLELPERHIEKDIQKGLVAQMKMFLLDLGADFVFIGSEYRLQVGVNDFFIDLLFFHRELQCLVAVEIKTTKFKPEYLGQLEFYLEALDRDVKKLHENPSIGILLCKNADSETVEYALSRSLSPTMIAKYKQQLMPKEELQKLLQKYNIA